MMATQPQRNLTTRTITKLLEERGRHLRSLGEPAMKRRCLACKLGYQHGMHHNNDCPRIPRCPECGGEMGFLCVGCGVFVPGTTQETGPGSAFDAGHYHRNPMECCECRDKRVEEWNRTHGELGEQVTS